MTIKQVMEKAIEGGYEPKYIRASYVFDDPKRDNPEYELTGIFLDPSFWQSLGKTLGWKPKKDYKNDFGHLHKAGWFYQWHSFIDHLAEGKTPEEFFKNLN